VQNILTIIQQKMINRLPDEMLEPVVATKSMTPKSRGSSSGTRSRKKR
jgi:hypothetical protein